jgi:protocatechuate 3,4-dioxygenase beta subunit
MRVNERIVLDMQREQSTRREALLIIGAAGAELVACGSDGASGSTTGAAGTASGAPGMAGTHALGGNAAVGGRGGMAGDASSSGGASTSGGANGGQAMGGQATGGQGVAGASGASGGATEAGSASEAGADTAGGVGGDAGVVECTTKPEQTLGPYPNKVDLNRSDIRAGQQGAVLRLKLRVLTSVLCLPVSGATVELWQCNALGNYSEYSDFGTADQNWLRGFQLTNAAGVVEFVTIYPGWYPGRAVHVHFRIKRAGKPDFVSQLYFDDALSDQVLAQAPYSGHAGTRPRNEDDSIFLAGGKDLMLDVTTVGQEHSATFVLGV